MVSLYVPWQPEIWYFAGFGASIILASVGIVLVLIPPSLADRGLSGRVGALLLSLCAGFLLSETTMVRLHSKAVSAGLPLETAIRFEGVLQQDTVTTRKGGQLYSVRLETMENRSGSRVRASGTVIVLGEGPLLPWGSRVRVDSELQREVAKPGAGAAGKSSPASAAGAGSSIVAFAKPGALTSIGWERSVFRARSVVLAALVARINRLENRAASLFTTLFFGVRGDLPEEESYYFMRSGSIHILALSGMHLSILSAFLLAVFAPLLGKRRCLVLSSLLVAIYVFITGCGVSLIRAAVMFYVYAVAVAVERKAEPLQLLAAAFVLMVVVDPASAFSLSFELSFLALVGLFLLSNQAGYLLAPYLPRTISLAVAASIGATIVTTPLVAANFGIVYPVGIISGLLLSPLVTAFIWVGIVYLAVPEFATPVLALLQIAMDLLYRTIIATAEVCSRAPFVRTTDGYTASFVAVIILYLPSYLRKLVYELRFSKRDFRNSRSRRVDPQEEVRAELPHRARGA